jgi:hypothetical protein
MYGYNMDNFEITLNDGNIVKLNTSIFNTNEDGMIMLTSIANAIDRPISGWKKRNGIKAISDKLLVIKGGNGVQGTWADIDMTLDYCKWASPELYKMGITLFKKEIEVRCIRPEIIFGYDLESLLDGVTTINRQHRVGSYYIDFYLPEYDIAIEYDEEQHQYNQDNDNKREKYITDKIGCEFIRVKKGYECIGMNKIIKRIIN